MICHPPTVAIHDVSYKGAVLNAHPYTLELLISKPSFQHRVFSRFAEKQNNDSKLNLGSFPQLAAKPNTKTCVPLFRYVPRHQKALVSIEGAISSYTPASNAGYHFPQLSGELAESLSVARDSDFFPHRWGIGVGHRSSSPVLMENTALQGRRFSRHPCLKRKRKKRHTVKQECLIVCQFFILRAIAPFSAPEYPGNAFWLRPQGQSRDPPALPACQREPFSPK